MAAKSTIYDIAREAGVSTATVTRVVRGDANVKPATREKVQRIIDAHAYTPSASAQHLDGGHSKTIAIVLTTVTNLYFTRIYDAAYWEAESNGYSARLFQTRDNAPISRELVDRLIRERVDGVLFVGSIWSTNRRDLNDALARLKLHMPVAAICPPGVELDCIRIHSDLVRCSRLPVQHLHALGHQRIAFIGGSMQTKDSSKRAENFLDELRILGLVDDPAYHIDAGYDTESGERAVVRMLSGLDKKRWPTAMIAFNDMVAFGAIKQLKQLGLQLPHDMAIIGCDNQFFCPYTDPPLTSVDLHPEELAISAIRELLISREATSKSFGMLRESTLIVRESCGARLGYRKFE